MKKKRAFGLVEILVMLALLGVTAAVTITPAVNSAIKKQNEFASVVVNNDIANALASMQTDGELLASSSQDEFAVKLARYFNVNENITKNTDAISKKFASKYYDENGKQINLSPNNYELKFVTSSGASLALTYNKDAKIAKYVSDKSSTGVSFEAKNAALNAVTGFYDVNGSRGPNKLGVDVSYIHQLSTKCPENNLDNGNGQCICALSGSICKASNKTFDKNSCSCKCTRSCGAGMELDPNTCQCVCKQTKEETAYCKFDKNTCRLVTKNVLSPINCEANGGTWDKENCLCKCPNKTEKYGFAAPNPDNFCKYECNKKLVTNEKGRQVLRDMTQTEFNEQVKKNANDNSITTSWTAKDSSNNSCFTCNSNNSGLATGVALEPKAGYCSPKCSSNARANSLCAKNSKYYTWHDYKPGDVNSCKCTCNTDYLNSQVVAYNKNHKYRYLNLSADSNGVKVWSNLHSAYKCGAAAAGVKGYSGKKGASSEYVCNYANGNAPKCTQCKSMYNTESTLKTLSTTVYNNNGYLNDGHNQYVADTDTCSIKFNDSGIVANKSNASVYYHGDDAIWWAYVYSFDDTYQNVVNPNKEHPNYNDSNNDHLGKSYWNNIKTGISVTYKRWGDPIILNLTSNDEINPTFTTDHVNFKLLYNGNNGYNSVKTPWIKAGNSISNTYAFLVTGDIPSGPSVDVSYLFSDQKVANINGEKRMYTTGLEQLKNEFDSNNDNLINAKDENFSKLRIWYDKNNNAQVDKGELYTLNQLNITEINTNVTRSLNSSGSLAGNESALYGIQGEFKALTPFDPKNAQSNVTYVIKDNSDLSNDETRDRYRVLNFNNSRENRNHIGRFFSNTPNPPEVKADDANEDSQKPEQQAEYRYLASSLSDSGAYNSQWYKWSDDIENQLNNSNKLNDACVILVKINDKYYAETVKKLSDVIFKF